MPSYNSFSQGSANKGDTTMGMQTPGGFGNQPDNYGADDAGLSGPHKIVFTHISACSAEQGISINELRAKTRNMGEKQLRYVDVLNLCEVMKS